MSDKFDQALKWVMGGLFLGSALILSTNVSYSKYGFITFLIGHLIGIYVFNARKDRAMLWHNIVFLFVDLWGIFRWFVV